MPYDPSRSWPTRSSGLRPRRLLQRYPKRVSTRACPRARAALPTQPHAFVATTLTQPPNGHYRRPPASSKFTTQAGNNAESVQNCRFFKRHANISLLLSNPILILYDELTNANLATISPNKAWEEGDLRSHEPRFWYILCCATRSELVLYLKRTGSPDLSRARLLTNQGSREEPRRWAPKKLAPPVSAIDCMWERVD
jgi:hypothetical protein